MSESFITFLSGILMGFAIAILFLNSVPTEAKKVIAECEKKLPRDQNCTLVALPISKD